MMKEKKYTWKDAQDFERVKDFAKAADAYVELGDLRRAETLLRELERRFSFHKDLKFKLGRVLALTGQWDEAIIKLQEAGTGHTCGLLYAYLNLLSDCDIFDQVRAKLHKAVGRAALAEGLKQQAAEHYRRAIELHDKVGIKKELEVLERELKKEQQPDAHGGGS